jgi:plasmid stability protein
MATKEPKKPKKPELEKIGLYLPKHITHALRVAAATHEKGISDLAAELLDEGLGRLAEARKSEK